MLNVKINIIKHIYTHSTKLLNGLDTSDTTSDQNEETEVFICLYYHDYLSVRAEPWWHTSLQPWC